MSSNDPFARSMGGEEEVRLSGLPDHREEKPPLLSVSPPRAVPKRLDDCHASFGGPFSTSPEDEEDGKQQQHRDLQQTLKSHTHEKGADTHAIAALGMVARHDPRLLRIASSAYIMAEKKEAMVVVMALKAEAIAAQRPRMQ